MWEFYLLSAKIGNEILNTFLLEVRNKYDFASNKKNSFKNAYSFFYYF